MNRGVWWVLLVSIGAVLCADASAQVTRLQQIQRLPPDQPQIDQAQVDQSQVNQVQVDYRAKYEKERARTAELRAEVAALQQRLDEWTRRDGSLVHAYCESDGVSRNSAGAYDDCGAKGYRCEPVSGLCRTSANASSDCFGSWIYCATNRQCVAPHPRACPHP
jgi:hypothetical protein